MRNWSYYTPTKITFGTDCLEKIFSIVEFFNPKKIMLVTGKKSMKKSGVTNRIVDYLKDYKVIIYDKAAQNPTIRSVENGIRFVRSEKCDLVMGLGGGSAIDTAKAISVLAKNPGPVDEYLSKSRKIANRRLPLVAIPTTAGTGTEVTQYASVTDEKLKRKLSLSHEYIHPDMAIVDPRLTVSMPKFVTATTGLDALSQCIEAYWSKFHTPVSDIFAVKGTEIIFRSLVNAFLFPKNVKFREQMILASLFSGIAISITRTTIVHSVSYPLTVHFKVPHGLACSLTLPSFIKFNSKVVRGRIWDIARTVGATTIGEFIRKVEELISNVGLPDRLSAVGVEKEDIELIVKEGFRPDRANNNPRKVTEEELRQILLDIL